MNTSKRSETSADRAHRPSPGNLAGCWLSILIAGLIPLAKAQADSARPRHIVSINLCADQFILLLAEPETIASVTYLADNPRVSALAKAARRIPKNYGQAEEILRFKPDLVLASVLSSHSTNALLRKLGIAVLEIQVATRIRDIRENIRKIAGAIGRSPYGAALLERFDRQLDALNQRPSTSSAVAALYRENNILYGANTLPGSFLSAAGLRNLADRIQLDGYSDLPLEILLEQQPDLLITGNGGVRARSGIRAYRNLAHPALLKLLARRQWVQVPERLWACGSPAIVEAIAILAAAHQNWKDSQGTNQARDEAR